MTTSDASTTTTTTTTTPTRAVRLPFRVLAGVLFLLCVGNAVALAYVAWKSGVKALKVHDVLMVPGVLCGGRWMLAATFRAPKPARDHGPLHPYWPFASGWVAFFYFLSVTCFF